MAAFSEEAIFQVARAVGRGDARQLYLEQVCGSDAGLRARLDALLRAYDEERSFLERPAVSPPAPAEGETVTHEPVVAAAGELVAGRYKLLQEIGAGGMGTVWMAEQTEPVVRRVAVKLIRTGLDSRQVLARFEAERQALALMDHPNIAKVFDAGVTGEPGRVSPGEPGRVSPGEPGRVSAGRPFFVMELVKGTPITRYCDEHKLSIRDRLALFADLCRAVQHAHQKGVIHRDLKPSNVLVAPYDGRPVVKVIDFGVAKAAGQKLTEKTLFTGFGAVVGTPEYMSPEQAELNNQDIDTRSDVYALGVLLYELLTGTTPLTHRRAKEAALLEVLRLIREEESPRPSSRLSTTDELPRIAANRAVEPKRLTGLVRGELDWIVMKALEKDRTRRYETATGFAQDVERYLAGEPVLACPPSARYRLRKFVRKNRGPVAAVALVVLALVIGIAGTTAGLLEARKQAKRAVEATGREAVRADAEAAQRRKARQAVDDMYTQVARQWLAHEPRMQAVQREFLEKALRHYEELAAESGDDPDVRFETATALTRIASLHQRLGRNRPATDAFGRAIAMLTDLAAGWPGERRYREELADTLVALGYLQMYSNRGGPAEESFTRGLELYEQLIAEFGPAAPSARALPPATTTGRTSAGGWPAAPGAPRRPRTITGDPWTCSVNSWLRPPPTRPTSPAWPPC